MREAKGEKMPFNMFLSSKSFLSGLSLSFFSKSSVLLRFLAAKTKQHEHTTPHSRTQHASAYTQVVHTHPATNSCVHTYLTLQPCRQCLQTFHQELGSLVLYRLQLKIDYERGRELESTVTTSSRSFWFLFNGLKNKIASSLALLPASLPSRVPLISLFSLFSLALLVSLLLLSYPRSFLQFFSLLNVSQQIGASWCLGWTTCGMCVYGWCVSM